MVNIHHTGEYESNDGLLSGLSKDWEIVFISQSCFKLLPNFLPELFAGALVFMKLFVSEVRLELHVTGFCFRLLLNPIGSTGFNLELWFYWVLFRGTRGNTDR